MLKNFKNALSSAEMRSIKGGVADGGSCGFSVPSGAGFNIVNCSVTKAQAQAAVANYGGHWCCDSCGTSSYCATPASV